MRAIWDLSGRLDLSRYYDSIQALVGVAGRNATAPRLLVCLWLLAYSQGVGSAREVARLFLRETGMSFGAWRQQARVLEAMGRLGGGEPVTQVALDLGYDSVSAFSAMFRRAAGTTAAPRAIP